MKNSLKKEIKLKERATLTCASYSQIVPSSFYGSSRNKEVEKGTKTMHVL